MRPRTRALWLLGGGALLVAGTLGAYFAAISVVKGAVAAALGPRAQIREIRVGLAGLTLAGVHVRAPSGWPAEETFAADRLSVAPRLLTLVSGGVVRIRSIELVAPYLSVVRTASEGIEALPSVFGADAPAGPSNELSIGEIEIDSGVLELFDATIATPPQKIRLEQLQASVRDLSMPGLAGRSVFELEAVVKGHARDGQGKLSGWAEVAERDSNVSIELRGVDLVPLQPYFVKPGEAGVRRGSFDLDLKAEVTKGNLAAHGRVTLEALELASERGLGKKFLGVSHKVVLAAMKDRGGRLTFDFTLTGHVDDPHFSLNEALGRQIAFSLAESLGVTVGGVVKGVGSLGVKGGHAVGEAVKGAGGAISDLLEGDPRD